MSRTNNIVKFGLCDNQNNQWPSKSYQPSASADNLYLEYSGYHQKNSSNDKFSFQICWLLHYILHTMIQTLKSSEQNRQVIYNTIWMLKNAQKTSSHARAFSFIHSAGDWFLGQLVTFLCPFIGCLQAEQYRGFPLEVCGCSWITVTVTKTNKYGVISLTHDFEIVRLTVLSICSLRLSTYSVTLGCIKVLWKWHILCLYYIF